MISLVVHASSGGDQLHGGVFQIDSAPAIFEIVTVAAIAVITGLVPPVNGIAIFVILIVILCGCCLADEEQHGCKKIVDLFHTLYFLIGMSVG